MSDYLKEGERAELAIPVFHEGRTVTVWLPVEVVAVEEGERGGRTTVTWTGSGMNSTESRRVLEDQRDLRRTSLNVGDLRAKAAALLTREVVCELLWRLAPDEHVNKILGTRSFSLEPIVRYARADLLDAPKEELRELAAQLLDTLPKMKRAPDEKWPNPEAFLRHVLGVAKNHVDPSTRVDIVERDERAAVEANAEEREGKLGDEVEDVNDDPWLTVKDRSGLELVHPNARLRQRLSRRQQAFFEKANLVRCKQSEDGEFVEFVFADGTLMMENVGEKGRSSLDLLDVALGKNERARALDDLIELSQEYGGYQELRPERDRDRVAELLDDARVEIKAANEDVGTNGTVVRALFFLANAVELLNGRR